MKIKCKTTLVTDILGLDIEVKIKERPAWEFK